MSRKTSHCVDCGKLIWNGSTRCCACNNRHRWADPEYKARASRSMSDNAMANPELRRFRSEQVKGLWEDGTIPNGLHEFQKDTIRYKTRMRHIKEGQARFRKGPRYTETMRRRSKAMKKHWKDPEYRKRVKEGQERARERKSNEQET